MRRDGYSTVQMTDTQMTDTQMTAVKAIKAGLRKDAGKHRASMGAQAREEADQKIFARVCHVLMEHRPAWVYCFVSRGSEVDTHRLIRWCFEQGIPVAVPRVEGTKMRFYRITSFSQLTPGCMGILEPTDLCEPAEISGLADTPKPTETIKPAETSAPVMIVPGLLFDESGNRLGYGGGYYDGFLAAHPECFRLGIGYELQVTGSLETEPHDERLDMLITEKRQLQIERRSK